MPLLFFSLIKQIMSEFKTIPVIQKANNYKQKIPTNYHRPKNTATDSLQNREAIEKKLGGYVEVKPEEIDYLPHNSHVRYITLDKQTSKPLFRLGGFVVRVYPDYLVLKGANNTNFSVQRNVFDGEGNRLYTARFFRKLKESELNKEYQEELSQKDEEIKKLKAKLKKLEGSR